MSHPSPLILALAVGGVVVVLAGLGYGGYMTRNAFMTLSNELATTTAARNALADELDRAREENMELSQRLADELAKNTTFENQISDIASTVGTLTKLSQTDKELLQKYSRVYFLNENYVPSDLTVIDSSRLLQPERSITFHAKALPYLLRMLDDANDAGSPILVISAYRSFAEQKALKGNYVLTYGTGANKFSADQGYSEHQLGTTVDLTTKTIAGTSIAFASSTAGEWLAAHAWEYGFILSYPKGNTYYQYEPWHWRFVGTALARELHETGKRFYDLPQREIDTYLGAIFD